MSHFVVLVFGEDVEEQLAPYSEDIEMDPYWTDEATDHPSQHFAYRIGVAEGKIPEDITMEGFCDFLNGRYSEEGEKYRVENGVLQRLTTYNPLSEWDWWVVGGRWKNMLLKFDGTPCDEGLISEIDWKGMEEKAAAEAEKTIDSVLLITSNRAKPKPFSYFTEKYPGSIAMAREKFWEQPVIKAINAHDDLKVFLNDPVSVYCLDQDDPKQAFIDRHINQTPAAYAVVKDGKWMAQGRMGSWGFRDDNVTDEKWAQQVKQLIRDNPDEYITVVDCHI